MRWKPIRVFYSVMSGKFYASRAYKAVKPGVVEITGEAFDVTNDIASQIIAHNLEFKYVETKPDAKS